MLLPLAGAAIEAATGPRRASLSSSWITEAVWDNGTLTLHMNGRTYDWPDADGSLFEGITTAPSAGQYFNQHLKGHAGNTGNRLGGYVRTGLLAGGRLLTRGFGS